MIRVIIDTNVLISGTFWSSSSFQILRLIDEKHLVLIVSQPILAEYDEVLHREEIMEKQAYSEERAESSAKIVAHAHLVDPQLLFHIIKDDPDDDKFIDAAIEGKATYIISKDNHLLSIREFEGIKIVTPDEFMILFGSLKK